MISRALMRGIDRWAEICLRYRKTVLLVVAALSTLAFAQMGKVRFDNALEIWFVRDDPGLVAHRELIDTFGSDELIVIGLEAPDVFAPDVLDEIDRITRAVEKAPHVEKVFSLTNIESIEGKEDLLEIHDLIEFPLDEKALPAIRQRALANELYVGNVVSADGTFTCIIARLPHYTDDFEYKIEGVSAIREIVEREAHSKHYLSGGPTLDEVFYSLSEKDSARTIPLMLGLLVVVLWGLLRSVVGGVLPICTVVLATVWAIAWMVLAGSPINAVTTMLPPLLLAVGVADSMHVLVEYQNRCRAGVEKMAALRAVYHELMIPLFLTSLTTAIGMLSLAISKVAGIRDFGIFAALGVAGAFFLSVTFVPIVLSYLPPPRPRKSSGAPRFALAGTVWLEHLHTFTMRYRKSIATVSVVLLALGVAGATRIRPESSFLALFKKDAKIRLDTERIQDALAGTVTIDVTIDSGREDGIKDPELLRSLVGLEDFLESQPHVSSAQSIAGYFKDMRRAFFANDQREYRLPETREEAAQYLLLYEMDAPDGDIKEYATFDYRKTRVSARVDLDSSNAAVDLVRNTKEYLRHNMPAGVHADVSGIILLYADMEEYIRDSLIRGFTIAMIAIFVVFCIQMRSIGLGSIAMIPNVTPIVITLGIMGVAGINLDSMTAMVASVAIGLAVDDSIHYLSRVTGRIAAGSAMVPALHDATIEVGRALIFTSLTLCAGFGVMLVGSFVGQIYFGLLCMLTIVFALAADLLLLPVVLRWYDERLQGAKVLGPVARTLGNKIASLL